MESDYEISSDSFVGSSLPTIISPGSKVPTDQDAITEFLESRSNEETSSTIVYDRSNDVVALDQDTFVSVSLCCTIILCFFLILTRSR